MVHFGRPLRIPQIPHIALPLVIPPKGPTKNLAVSDSTPARLKLPPRTPNRSKLTTRTVAVEDLRAGRLGRGRQSTLNKSAIGPATEAQRPRSAEKGRSYRETVRATGPRTAPPLPPHAESGTTAGIPNEMLPPKKYRRSRQESLAGVADYAKPQARNKRPPLTRIQKKY